VLTDAFREGIRALWKVYIPGSAGKFSGLRLQNPVESKLEHMFSIARQHHIEPDDTARHYLGLVERVLGYKSGTLLSRF
jgi:hypothetical protein